MTSLQIVDYINDERKQVAAEGGKKYTELLHKSFLTKVVAVLGESQSAKYFADYTDTRNRQQIMYLLPKREASLLAMSYSFALQAKVYDHMTALEEALKEAQVFKLPDFTSPVESARAWAIEYERAEELKSEVASQNVLIELKEIKIAEQAPKVKFYDTVRNSGDTQTMQQVAKVLGMGPNNLFKWLRDNEILMSGKNNHNLPYQRHLQEGHFRVVETSFEDKFTGEVHITTKTLVTGKGLTYIQKKLS